MTTMDDDHTYQDSPLPTSGELEQVFGHRVHDPLPFFNPSASNWPHPAAGSLVPDSVSSINGEADSSSGLSYHDLSQQELPSVMLNSIFRNPNVPQDFQPPVPVYQDSPLPTPDQLEQLLLHLQVKDDPFPFLDPSAPNTPLVSSIDGETDSSSTSRVYFRCLSVDETPMGLLYSTFRNPYFWNRPPYGFHKVNIAVSVCNNEGNQFLGLAAVIRDRVGFVHQAFTKVWREGLTPFHLKINEAELEIFNLALELCIVYDYRMVILETESLRLVRQARELYDEEDFRYLEVRQIGINDNILAHRFASVAHLYDGVYWATGDTIHVFGTARLPYN